MNYATIVMGIAVTAVIVAGAITYGPAEAQEGGPPAAADSSMQRCVTAADSTLLVQVAAKVERHEESGRSDLLEMFTRSYDTMQDNDNYTTADIKARPDKQQSNWQGAGPNALWQSVYVELDRLQQCRADRHEEQAWEQQRQDVPPPPELGSYSSEDTSGGSDTLPAGSPSAGRTIESIPACTPAGCLPPSRLVGYETDADGLKTYRYWQMDYYNDGKIKNQTTWYRDDDQTPDNNPIKGNTFYWPNGTLWYDRAWHDNGNLWYNHTYVNGIVASSASYDRDGSTQSNVTVVTADRFTRLTTSWSEDGKKISEVQRDHDNDLDYTRYYHENGNLSTSVAHHGSAPDNIYEWYPDGNIKKITRYHTTEYGGVRTVEEWPIPGSATNNRACHHEAKPNVWWGGQPKNCFQSELNAFFDATRNAVDCTPIDVFRSVDGKTLTGSKFECVANGSAWTQPKPQHCIVGRTDDPTRADYEPLC